MIRVRRPDGGWAVGGNRNNGGRQALPPPGGGGTAPPAAIRRRRRGHRRGRRYAAGSGAPKGGGGHGGDPAHASQKVLTAPHGGYLGAHSSEAEQRLSKVNRVKNTIPGDHSELLPRQFRPTLQAICQFSPTSPQGIKSWPGWVRKVP